jgi:putative hydrolase of the HAD superfamily
MIAAVTPRAILLDALGTLLALEDPAPRLAALLSERHAIEVTAERAAAALAVEMAYYRTHCIEAGDERRLAELRLRCAALLARELGDAAAELQPAALLPTLLDSLRFAPYADVVAALERWRAGGARLVVASNWDISLHAVLEWTGLRALLDAVVTSAELGAAKPAGELFAAALSLAGAQAWQSVHIGDSLFEDVEGARAAGIEAVWLRRSNHDGAPAAPPQVRVIASLAEF